MARTPMSSLAVGENAPQLAPVGNGLEIDVAIASIQLQALLHEGGDVARNAG